MPDLNLKDEEEFSDENQNYEKKPRKARFHGSGRGGGNTDKILIIATIVILLILGAVMLNQFGVVNLWGTGDTRVTVALPPLEDEVVEPVPEPREPTLTPAPEIREPEPEDPPRQEPATRPAREPEPERETPREIRPSGTGQYSVQVSSWRSRQNADRQAQQLRDVGKDAFVSQGTVNGTTWYRVQIGRYQTIEEAERAAENFQLVLEAGWVVVRIDN